MIVIWAVFYLEQDLVDCWSKLWDKPQHTKGYPHAKMSHIPQYSQCIVRGCKECPSVLHPYGDVRSVPVYYIRTGMLGVFLCITFVRGC